MKSSLFRIFVSFVLVTVSVFGASLGILPARIAQAATLCVNPGGTGGCYTTIQAAINDANPGDTINVAAGTYTEQLTINKSLHLVGAGVGVSIIQAPNTLPDGALPTSAIILISGSGVDVEITGLTVTGPGPTGCGSIRAGIYVYDNANANIHHNRIQDVRDSTFSGCQNGVAILVGRQAWATTGTAVIANNTIVGYQKGGIVVDNTGSNATIANNTVTGAGTISIIAQNGIQISRGATAILSGNTITGNSFHIAGNTWDWGAAGMLLYQSGAVTLSGGNVAAGNDTNLYIQDSDLVTLGAETFGPSTAPVDFGYNIVNDAHDLDATHVTFQGASDIDSLIWDKLDDSALGLVTWNAKIDLAASSPLFCTGETSKVKINLTNIGNLYGYQFTVSYNDSKVSASGAFVDDFFTTASPASKPWNASCSGGTCKFSVSHVAPQTAVSGSGAVAEITFTGLNAGEFDVTLNSDILSDRDANVIGHMAGGPLHLAVCGYATASGVVSLQGRASPIDAGTVTLTDGAFGTYSTSFDPGTGAWSISNIKVVPGGTSYTFDATHGLYLGNQKVQILNPGDNYNAGSTKLKGGDADNSGAIGLNDLTCIGGSFGGAPVVCGTTGSSDINADGTVNILDLVLAGGNYELTTPQSW